MYVTFEPEGKNILHILYVVSPGETPRIFPLTFDVKIPASFCLLEPELISSHFRIQPAACVHSDFFLQLKTKTHSLHLTFLWNVHDNLLCNPSAMIYSYLIKTPHLVSFRVFLGFFFFHSPNCLVCFVFSNSAQSPCELSPFDWCLQGIDSICSS